MQNAYFPLFITEDVLNTEKDHVEGFAPGECGGKCGEGGAWSPLEEANLGRCPLILFPFLTPPPP